MALRDMVEATYTWLFVRGADALTIERVTTACLAVSSSTGERQVHDFPSPVDLLEFQLAFHDHLIATGWVLEEFYPERRGSRGGAARVAADRRVLRHVPRRRPK